MWRGSSWRGLRKLCRDESNWVTPLRLLLTNAGAASINQDLRQGVQEETRDFVDEHCGDGNIKDHLCDPPPNLVSVWPPHCWVSYGWISEGRPPLKLSVLTWIIHCVNHDLSIQSVNSMLMHQRGDLRWIRLLSHSTVIPVVPLVPITLVSPLCDRPASDTCSISRTYCRLGEGVFGTVSSGSPATCPHMLALALDMIGRRRTGHFGELFGDEWDF